ncbi:hypothetical protein C0989_010984 [Termitomyces sp. Mn162]|nr:hypothetical protein C0989_010984 [Termitomyces sp. Mn162]
MAVSPFATGNSTHIRWSYPKDENDKRLRYLVKRARRYQVDHTATYSMRSCSSISSGESSSEDPPVITPNSSFDTPASLPVTPHRNNKLLTRPPRLSPKKLQRSPPGRWITENGAARIMFVEESEEQMKFREMQDEIKHQCIEERELEILLRERDIAKGEEIDFDMDVETTTSGTWRDQDVSEVNTGEHAPAAYIRGDTEPLEEIPLMTGSSSQVRPLGPNGTELIDPVTFMPYSMGSLQTSRIETWRQGVL